MILAIVERFDHKLYVRGELVDRVDHYKLKMQGGEGSMDADSMPSDIFLSHFKKKFDYKFCDEVKENLTEPPHPYSCWCQVMSDYLLKEGFEPFDFNSEKGLHFFVKRV